MFDQSIIWLLSISSQIASLKLSSLNSSVFLEAAERIDSRSCWVDY